jgi:septum formation inhibitor-activating ATPase MinD
VDLFKTGGGEKAATELGVAFLGRIPVDPRIVASGDDGRPFTVHQAGSEAADAFRAIVDKILKSGES